MNCFNKSVGLGGLVKKFGLERLVREFLKKTHQLKDYLESKLKELETYVYERDEAVVGLITIKGNLLKSLYVDPDCQGDGVGDELLRHAELVVSNKGFNKLLLYSYHNSLGFYEQKGYHKVRGDVYTTKMKKII